MKTTALLVVAAAINSADAQEPPACAPAAIVGGELRDEVIALLRERGVTEPIDGCAALEAEVNGNGTGLIVTLIDGDRSSRRAATPEIAAGIIAEEAMHPDALAQLIPFRPAAALTDGLAAEDARRAPGPWLVDVPALPSLAPAGDIDLWESIALDGVLGGPVQIQGFSLRPGAYLGPRVAYLDRPFAFGPAPDAPGLNAAAGGGARVIVAVPYPTRTIDLSLGAGFARIAPLLPIDTGDEPDAGSPLRIIHLGIGFDLGRPRSR